MKKLVFAIIFLFFLVPDSRFSASAEVRDEPSHRLLASASLDRHTPRTTKIRRRSTRNFRKKPIFRVRKSKTFFRHRAGDRVRRAFLPASILRRRPTFRSFRQKSISKNPTVVRLFSRPILQSRPVISWNSDSVEIFELGLSRSPDFKSVRAPSVAKFTGLKFQIFDNSGSATNPTDFSIDFDGKIFRFDRSGQATLKFKNFRLPPGKTSSIRFGIRVADPEKMPILAGSLRVRIFGATAVDESTFEKIPVKISGTTVSRTIRIDPIATTSNSGVATATSTRVHSKILAGGDRAIALGLNFSANFDDLSIRRLKFFNKFGQDAGSMIEKASIFDIDTGAKLASTKFIRGKADFRFSPGIRINRGSQIRLGLEIQVKQKPKTVDRNSKLQIELESSEIVSLATGRDLSDSDKNIDIDSVIFQIASGKIRVSVPLGQEDQSFVPSGNLDRFFRFKIQNLSRRPASLGRISFKISLGGVEFTGGVSPDDVRLVRLDESGREVSGTEFLASIDGDTFIYDAKTQSDLPRHRVADFVLKLRLSDLPGNDRGDFVKIQILSDSDFDNGKISNLRAVGRNFIWSDHSASPHDLNSTDWLSGRLVPGIPTSPIVFRR